MQNRALSVLAATLAALAIGSAPALAGENDDDGDDDDSPSQVQNLPAPAAEAPAGAPQGGVATGLGGTAPDAPGSLLLAGLASGGLLLTGAGTLVAVRRRVS